jgi:hypothetical protein
MSSATLGPALLASIVIPETYLCPMGTYRARGAGRLDADRRSRTTPTTTSGVEGRLGMLRRPV